MRGLVIIFALVAATLLAPAAHADGKAAAKEAFRRATQHYNLGNFGKALDGFKEAYLDFPDPSFLFNIGQCQRQLGQKQEAVLSYRAYLREAPNAPNQDEVQGLIANLEKLIREDEAAKNGRPQGTLGPGEQPPAEAVNRPATPPPTEPPSPLTTTAPPPPAEKPTPLYKKWWPWTIVGVAAVGLGVGLGVGLSSGGTHYPSGSFTDGTVHF